jgi:23S rRNA (adenine2503-C2)-methyltransferase
VPEPLPLQALLPEELSRLVPSVTLDEARSIVSTVHRDKDPFAPSSRVRRLAREAVRRVASVPGLAIEHRAESALDPFVKLVFRTHDDRLVESVRIPLERAGRYSVCVSSQVGCALGCTFCATGRLGLARNLETWEIVEQVRAVRRTLDAGRGERVHGVVFQGMGEPLANAERVIAAVRVLTDPSAAAIDARNVTICTSGLPHGIRLLEDVFSAGVEHARATGLAPLWAVTLLSGVNDGDDDARALGELAARFTRETGRRPRISVIPYNRIAEDETDPYRRTSELAETRFRDSVHAHGVYTHKRYSGGSDVAAACGQLAARL